ncbi:hypothetical protein LTR53_012240 [Teratosphaeriaceae sp. CCFEE 6253]|nr:hypothetical protein LTR53_012240 [Teratosphaeriaceae sp. CCFEE 6253]
MALQRRLRFLGILAGLLFLTVICLFVTLGGSNNIRRVSLGDYAHDKLGGGDRTTTSTETTTWPNDAGPNDQVPALGHDADDEPDNDETDADEDADDDDTPANDVEPGDYRELFSLTTRDRKFFPLYFAGDEAYNPNIIPHPTRHDMWIVVAQHEQSGEAITVSGELVCEAGFLDGVLVCAAPPTILPITPSISGVCPDDLAYMNFRSGPRDARMFYGPAGPMILYGSQSQYACLGIWVQDVRMLLDSFHLERFAVSKLFMAATELRRPAPWKGIEKNFFVFWSLEGKAYVHHDLVPERVFAELDFDGTVGPNLAPASAAADQACLASLMPHAAPDFESIHQATNSLSITLCERGDATCTPGAHNTFLAHLFHHKTYYDFHGIYEPYVILFQSVPPFAVHAVSQRPLWIHGRAPLTKFTGSLQYAGRPESDIPAGHTEMFYMTSMSWRGHDQKYHGYLDDVLFLAFGIEDTRAAAIDVKASDLLQDLAFC